VYRVEGKEYMASKIKTYRDLDIWKAGIRLVENIYKLTERFPEHELYSLVSQMRRSAISIPSNVAEGFRRYHNKEYKQFLYMSLGSCAELETQVTIAKELRYIQENKEIVLLEDLDHICRMISNLIKKL
jgi:four helix bundle protein